MMSRFGRYAQSQILTSRCACGLLLLVGGAALAETASSSTGGSPRMQPERIEVQPSTVNLTTRRCTMRLLVTGVYADGTLKDLTHFATFGSSDAHVASIRNHQIAAAGNGNAQISVNVGEVQAKVNVQVQGWETTDPVSFQNETLAALTARGCNSGGCHGSPSGKAGFRLSLEAYDTELDTRTLIREAYGRRVDPIEPHNSLMLLKPLMEVAHGGGQRLRQGDEAYNILHTWIAEGCRVDRGTVPACVRLEVLPGNRLLYLPNATQQLVALAHYEDGSVRDVTHVTKFSSSDDSIAAVSSDGLVTASRRGEAAIMARYLEHLESTLFTFVQDVEGFTWNDAPARNYIDEHVHRKLRQIQFLPSDTCTDAEFLRRVFLDVTGRLPSPKESASFLDDPSSSKRAALVDQLLNSRDYATFWALHWSDLLRVKKQNITDEGTRKFYRWIVDAFDSNMPFDRFCHSLLTAGGSTFSNPPANYYRSLKDTHVSTESTAQVFLGVRIQCAKCHNHPFEKWTQDNYYGLSAFFNRVRTKEGGRAGEKVIWSARDGEVTQPRTGQTMQLWLPQQGTVTNPEELDRRHVFADWLTDSDNPFFARVAVNRIWAHVMGRGIVHPVDDFRESNPPANAELLDALSEDFRASGFDQKHILRTILNSNTYQRSARTNPFNQEDHKYFSHAQVRMLTAEQLLDAICDLTGVPETFEGLPQGTRATQLPSPDQKNEFLKTFGQPDRETACACERSSDSNLSQALQLFNSARIHAKLKADGNRFRRGLAAGTSVDDVISELYLAAFSRRPSPPELEHTRTYISQREDQESGFEDLCWSLINAKEFLFQH